MPDDYHELKRQNDELIERQNSRLADAIVKEVEDSMRAPYPSNPYTLTVRRDRLTEIIKKYLALARHG